MEIHDIDRHLSELFGMAIRMQIEGKIEIRCLAEDRPAKWAQFPCTQAGLDGAASYARRMTLNDYNVYVVAAILKPHVHWSARDADCLCAAVHFVDVDHDADSAIEKVTVAPSFVVVTG